MQIFLKTLNPGTYTFSDLGGYTITHPVGPIPLVEPSGEFYEEDIQQSSDLIEQVIAGNIQLTNEGGESISNLNDLQQADPGIFVRNTGDEDIAGVKSFTTGLNVAGTTNYELAITDDDDIPNKKYVDDLLGGIGVNPDLPAIQLRTTSVFNIPSGNFDSIPFDIIDVQNDVNVLERNSLDIDEILIKSDGFYLVTYVIHSDGDNNNKDFRILLNNSTVLEGSQSIRNDSTDSNRSTVSVTIVKQFTAGDFIELQAQGSATNGTIDPPAVLAVVKLEANGAKGDAGPQGPQGPPGIEGPMPACQLRRSSLAGLPTTWTDVGFDVLDFQNDTEVLERSTTTTDDITIKAPGLYWVHYNFTADDELQGRVRFNDSVVLPGTTKQSGDVGDSLNIITLCTASVIYNVTSPGKFTCQLQSDTTGEILIAEGTFLVFKLEGVQGLEGPAGVNGKDGSPGYGIYAWSETEGTGTQLESTGLSVSRTAEGFYSYTFDTAATTSNYNVFVQPVYAAPLNNSVEVEVYNKTTTGFEVRTNAQDDGSGTGASIDIRHSVSVLGLASELGGNQNASKVTIDNSVLDVVTNTNLQDWIEDADTAFLNARSTGIRFGGNLVELTGLNVRILAGAGEILDNSNFSSPSYSKVEWVDTDFDLSIYSDQVIFIYVDSTGTVLISTSSPTLADYRLNIWLWRISVRGGVISGTTSIVQPVQQYGSQIRELWQALGEVKDGLTIAAGGTDLTLQMGSGSVYISGSNFYNNSLNPTNINFNTINPVTFKLVDQTGAQSPERTTIDPSVYDNNGILTSIPGNNSRATILQWHFFPGSGNHRIFYGQQFYSSVIEATNALKDGNYNPSIPSIYSTSIILGWVIVSKSASNLNDGNQVFISSSRFGLVGGGVSSSTSSNSISVLPSITNNPVDTINFNSTDFIVANGGGASEALVSLQTKSLYSILKVSSTGADQSKNYNVTTLTDLTLTGSVVNLGTASADFSNNNGTITCNFDGAIRVRYMVPHFSTGQRTHLKATIQINGVDVSPASYGYIRSANGQNRETLNGEDVFSVTTGDIVRVGIIRGEGSTITTAATLESNVNIIIERLQ